MDDYLLFKKRRLITDAAALRCDVFVSAYNLSERVRELAKLVRAKARHWLILPEYHLHASDHPTVGRCFAGPAEDEAGYLSDFLNTLGPDLGNKRVIVDITGFLCQYVPPLFALLHTRGVRTVDVIYGEPLRYLRSERTRFSDQSVVAVRQIAGFEGAHHPDTSQDLLVMAVGYDHHLIAAVAGWKEHARKVQLFGLPSLRPDMYQESILATARVAEAVGPDASLPRHFVYASAYDPFVAGGAVSDIVRAHRQRHPDANVYLAPLSTKTHALGMAIFYLRECVNTATSIVYPFCVAHEPETSEGLSGAWLFRVELPVSE